MELRLSKAGTIYVIDVIGEMDLYMLSASRTWLRR